MKSTHDRLDYGRLGWDIVASIRGNNDKVQHEKLPGVVVQEGHHLAR